MYVSHPWIAEGHLQPLLYGYGITKILNQESQDGNYKAGLAEARERRNRGPGSWKGETSREGSSKRRDFGRSLHICSSRASRILLRTVVPAAPPLCSNLVVMRHPHDPDEVLAEVLVARRNHGFPIFLFSGSWRGSRGGLKQRCEHQWDARIAHQSMNGGDRKPEIAAQYGGR